MPPFPRCGRAHLSPAPGLPLKRPGALPARKEPPFSTRNPERTREAILAAATEEFSQNGLDGARVDRIDRRAGVNKRMLYHYFGNKDDLFLAVLEAVYRDIRSHELELNLESLAPTAAMRELVEYTFDYYIANPHFIRLLNNENL